MTKKDLIPDSFKDLTNKERKFMEIFISDPSQTITAISHRVFDCKNDNIASSYGSRVLRKVRVPINEIMERMGAGIVNNIRKMKNLQDVKTTKFIPSKDKENKKGYDEIELEDNTTQLKATELAFKVGGHLQQSNPNIPGGNTNIQINISEIKQDASLGDKIKQFGNMLSEANRGKS